MSKIKLTGSNSGYVELDSAADAGNLTLTLPTSGVRLLSNTDNVFSGITTTAELDINGKIDVSTDIVGGRNLKVTGITTLSDDLTLTGASYNVLWDKSDNQLEFGDNAKLSFGASSDLQIYHESNNNYINATNGTLFVRGSDLILEDAGGNDYVVCADTGTGGSVTLKHEGSSKLVTASGGVTVTGTVAATSFSGSGEGLTRTTQSSHRSVVYNGAMKIAQRGTSFTGITASGTFPVDRFLFHVGSLGTWTLSQSTDVPTGQGLGHSIKCDVTTANASPSGTAYARIDQRFEGQDLQRFCKGTANAKNFAVSFWVKSPKTGTHIVQLQDQDNSRNVSKAYTVSSANTWEKKELIFPADTTGAFGNDNGGSLFLCFYLAVGTGYQGGTLQTTWGTPVNNTRATGQVNVADSTSNDFYLTGVQMEEGIVTPFEHRSFGEELYRCQRYFVKTDFSSHATAYFGGTHLFRQIPFHCPTPMRAQPSFSLSGAESGTVKFTLKTWSSDQNMTATPNAIHRYHTDYVHGTNSSAVHSLGLGIDYASSNSGVPPNGPGNHNVYSCRVYGAKFDAEL